MDKDEFL